MAAKLGEARLLHRERDLKMMPGTDSCSVSATISHFGRASG